MTLFLLFSAQFHILYKMASFFFLSIILLFLSQFQVRVFYMKVKHIVTARSFKWLTAYKKIGPWVTSLTRAAVPSSMNMLKMAREFADVTTGFSLKWFTNIVRSIKWKLVLQKFKPFLWNDLYFSCLKILLLCPLFDFCLLDLLCLFVWDQSNSVLNLNIFHSWNHNWLHFNLKWHSKFYAVLFSE